MPDNLIPFPSTPHLAWLGKGTPRDDKLLSSQEVTTFLAAPVVVEEKIDGANLGISFDHDGHVRCQNRGGYVIQPFAGQFSRLSSWLSRHEEGLLDALEDRLILFGEWCAATHSQFYDQLPDFFLGFDIYDTHLHRYWNTTQRDDLLHQLAIPPVKIISQGIFTLQKFIEMLNQVRSAYGPEPPEGFYMRLEGEEGLIARAKLVRPAFHQQIEEHWRNKKLKWNRIESSHFFSVT